MFLIWLRESLEEKGIHLEYIRVIGRFIFNIWRYLEFILHACVWLISDLYMHFVIPMHVFYDINYTHLQLIKLDVPVFTLSSLSRQLGPKDEPFWSSFL